MLDLKPDCAGYDSMRIRQEYLLGVGGIRALQAMGHEITGLHLNEGHCTFCHAGNVEAGLESR